VATILRFLRGPVRAKKGRCINRIAVLGFGPGSFVIDSPSAARWYASWSLGISAAKRPLLTEELWEILEQLDPETARGRVIAHSY
jgi:hypothetical protein